MLSSLSNFSPQSDDETRPRRDGTLPTGGSETALLRATDLGIVGTIFFVPFAMGGREALGQLLLVSLASLSTVTWLIAQVRQKKSVWIWSKVELLALAGVALLVLQLVSLPRSVIDTISPRIGEILPMWGSASDAAVFPGVWTQLSLTPTATLGGLVILLAYVALFFVVVQRVQCVDDVKRFLKLIAMATVAMAVFGLMQYFTSNRKFFWFYEHPFTGTDANVKGSFTNRNHFAHFIALGIGPLIWWVLDVSHKFRSPGHVLSSVTKHAVNKSPGLLTAILSISLSVSVFAALLSRSRGGAIAMCAAALTCVLALYRAKLTGGRLVFLLGGVTILIVMFMLAYAELEIQHRLDDIVSADVERLDRSGLRRDIWAAVMAGIADYPILGTGVGSHREVYPLYFASSVLGDNREFTHAENGYLNLALETGLTGLALALTAFGCCYYWCIQGIRRAPSQPTAGCLAAIIASLTASVVHAFADFAWYAPGCTVILIVLSACACRLWQMSACRASALVVPRFVYIGAVGGFCLLGCWMIQHQLSFWESQHYWYKYLRLALASREAGPDESREQLARDELSALTSAVRAGPNDARIQLRTGMAYLSYFNIVQRRSKNPMPLDQIRDAAMASQFESPEALNEWLNRAIGTNRKYLAAALQHCKRAVSLCPLQGRGYLSLAELSFLEGSGEETRASYLQQAMAVRPHDAKVLFVVGQEAMLAGNASQGIDYWRRAFNGSRYYQRQIIDMLAAHVPASFFIENFDPDRIALGRLRERYRDLNRSYDYRTILERYAAAWTKYAGNHSEVAAWLVAHRLYNELQQPKNAHTCLQAALAIDPNSFETRYRMGIWLHQQKQYSAAAEQLAWCSARRPFDRKLKQLAESATKEGLRRRAKL